MVPQWEQGWGKSILKTKIQLQDLNTMIRLNPYLSSKFQTITLTSLQEISI